MDIRGTGLPLSNSRICQSYCSYSYPDFELSNPFQTLPGIAKQLISPRILDGTTLRQNNVFYCSGMCLEGLGQVWGGMSSRCWRRLLGHRLGGFGIVLRCVQIGLGKVIRS